MTNQKAVAQRLMKERPQKIGEDPAILKIL